MGSLKSRLNLKGKKIYSLISRWVNYLTTRLNGWENRNGWYHTFYLLDTNICIFLIKRKPKVVLARLKKSLSSGVGVSSITFSELEYGVQKSSFVERNAISLLRFITPFDILPFDESAARVYGKVRASLEKKGQPIGVMDMLIGAHAKSLKTILVTNNTHEFNRIDGLLVEDWTKLK